LKFAKPSGREILPLKLPIAANATSPATGLEQKLSPASCHFWVMWKKSKGIGKKVARKGKELPEGVEKGAETVK